MPRTSKKKSEEQAASNVRKFPEREHRGFRMMLDQELAGENIVSMRVASNIFAHFGVNEGDIVLVDTDRKPDDGDLFAFKDPEDLSGQTITHYIEKIHRHKEIIGTVRGFQRYFR